MVIFHSYVKLPEGRSYDIYCILFNRLRRVPPATMEEHGFCVKQFLCKTALCVKGGLDAKTLVLFKPRFKFKPKHVCKPGFWKRPY